MTRPWVRLPLACVTVGVIVGLPAMAPDSAAAAPTTVGAPQPPLVNEQLVVADLSPSGLPSEAQLINRMVATNRPEQRVAAETSTVKVRYLNEAGQPEVSGNTVVYPVGGEGQTSVATQATFPKPLPVALHAEYATAGEGAQGVSPDSIAGTKGTMTVRYTVTNTSMQKQKIRYTDASGSTTTVEQPVFAPFVGTVVATLAPGVSLAKSGDAVVSTTAEGRTALQWNLVLYPPLGSYQQELSFTVNSDSLSIPALKMEVVPVANNQDPAVGFSAGLLSDSVVGNTKLASGLDTLDTSTIKLAQGAGQLTSAQQAQAKGTGDAYSGARQLTGGVDGLATGLNDLTDGITKLAKELPKSAAAADSLAAAVAKLAAGVGSASDPPIPTPPPVPKNVTLVQAIRAAQKAVGAAQTTALSAAADSTNAAGSVTTVYLAKCVPVPSGLTPPQCAALQNAIAKSTSSAAKSAGVAAGLQVINTQLLKRIETGLIAVSEGLRSGSVKNPGVYEGLLELQSGLIAASKGSKELAAASKRAANGAAQLAMASTTLSGGLGQLSAGAQQIVGGSVDLGNGLDQLHSDGTAKLLNSVVDSSSQPALANAYLTAASDRASDAAPYPAPAGATSRVAYVYSMTPPPTSPAVSVPALAIGGIFLAGVIVLIARRLRKAPTQ
ncbi:MAG: hypothetical protein ACOYD0_11565 [Candidatus Nanopelagicales bacterium]